MSVSTIDLVLGLGPSLWILLVAALAGAIAGIGAGVSSARGRPWPAVLAGASVGVPILVAVLFARLEIAGVEASLEIIEQGGLVTVAGGISSALLLRVLALGVSLIPAAVLAVGAAICARRHRTAVDRRWVAGLPLAVVLLVVPIFHGLMSGILLFGVVRAVLYTALAAPAIYASAGGGQGARDEATTGAVIGLLLVVTAGEAAAFAAAQIVVFADIGMTGNVTSEFMAETMAILRLQALWLVAALAAAIIWVLVDLITASRRGRPLGAVALAACWIGMVPMVIVLEGSSTTLARVVAPIEAGVDEPVELPKAPTPFVQP